MAYDVSQDTAPFRTDAQFPLHVPISEKLKLALTASPVWVILSCVGFLFAGWPALIGGIVAMAWMMDRIAKITRIVVHGRQTTGMLYCKEEIGRGGESSSTRYKCYFRYPDAKGNLREYVTWQGRHPFIEGTEYEMLYDPQRPQKTMLVAELPSVCIEETGTVRLGGNVWPVIGAILSLAAIAGMACYLGYRR